jgi:tetratricopeptide (TPR) repeat protein
MQGDDSSAARAYWEAIARSQGTIAAQSTENLARLLVQQGNYAAATEAFRDAIEHSREAAPMLSAQIARLLEQHQSSNATMAAYRNSIAHNQTNLAAQVAATARLLERRGEIDAAIAAYREAIERSRETIATQAAQVASALELRNVAAALAAIITSRGTPVDYAITSNQPRGTSEQNPELQNIRKRLARYAMNRDETAGILLDRLALLEDQRAITDDFRAAMIKLLAVEKPDLLVQAAIELTKENRAGSAFSERAVSELREALLRLAEDRTKDVNSDPENR